MLQETLRANIETKLNQNTYNYDGNLDTYPKRIVEFVLGQYAKDNDTAQDFVYNIKNGYRYIEKTYVPCMMKFSADYKAIPNTRTGTAVVNISFMIALDTDLDDKIAALDELVTKVIANNEVVSDNGTNYNTVWNMEAILPSGDIAIFNGTKYIELITTIYIGFSNSFYFGNSWTFYLDEYQLYPFASKTERNNELQSPQLLGQSEASSLVESSLWNKPLTVWISQEVSELLDDYDSDNYDPETVHYLQVISPTNQYTGTGSLALTLPVAQVAGVDYWSVYHTLDSALMTCYKLDMSLFTSVQIYDLLTETSNLTEVTYTAFVTSNTATICYNLTDNAIYIKIAKSSATTLAQLYTYFATPGNTIAVTMAIQGVRKAVLVQSIVDSTDLGELATATIVFTKVFE